MTDDVAGEWWSRPDARCWVRGRDGWKPGFVAKVIDGTVTVKQRRNSRTVYLTMLDQICERTLAKERRHG